MAKKRNLLSILRSSDETNDEDKAKGGRPLRGRAMNNQNTKLHSKMLNKKRKAIITFLLGTAGRKSDDTSNEEFCTSYESLLADKAERREHWLRQACVFCKI